MYYHGKLVGFVGKANKTNKGIILNNNLDEVVIRVEENPFSILRKKVVLISSDWFVSVLFVTLLYSMGLLSNEITVVSISNYHFTVIFFMMPTMCYRLFNIYNGNAEKKATQLVGVSIGFLLSYCIFVMNLDNILQFTIKNFFMYFENMIIRLISFNLGIYLFEIIFKIRNIMKKK